jgi:predicted membrane channel-forming protein YqfA (hemolysin III family)
MLYIKTTDGDIMNQLKTPENGYQSRICTSSLRLLAWSGAWLAATALMKFGPKFLWNRASVLTLLAVGLDVAVGVGMILANKTYIEQLDELQQKVYLNALGITAGVAVIVGVPFSVMGLYHVISFHAEIWHLLLLMGLTFMFSIAYGNWRYR